MWWSVCVVLASTIGVLVLLESVVLRTSSVPTPRGFPLLGNVFQILRRGRNLVHLAVFDMFQSFGAETFALRLFHRRFVVVTNPRDVQFVLGRQSGSVFGKSDDYKKIGVFLGKSMLLTEGGEWRRQRKLFAPQFHFESLQQFAPVLREKASILCQRLDKLAEHRTQFDAPTIFKAYALDVIGMIGFKHEFRVLQDLHAGFSPAMSTLEHEMMNSVIFPMRNVFFRYERRKSMEALEMLHVLVKRIIDFRKMMSDEKLRSMSDLLSIMIRAQRDGADWIDDVELRDQVMMFMFAGTDTSAITLTACVMLLAAHPRVQDTLCAELDDRFGSELSTSSSQRENDVSEKSSADRPREISISSVKSCEYLHAVVQESLRLYPPAPVVQRTSSSACQLPSGVTLPSNSTVTVMPWLIHRDPKYWGNDADTFRPERWLEKSELNSARKMSFIPFSQGPRNCLGMQFAYAEVKIALVAMLRRFKFSLPPSDDDRERHRNFEEQSAMSMTLWFPNGISLNVRRRGNGRRRHSL